MTPKGNGLTSLCPCASLLGMVVVHTVLGFNVPLDILETSVFKQLITLVLTIKTRKQNTIYTLNTQDKWRNEKLALTNKTNSFVLKHKHFDSPGIK